MFFISTKTELKQTNACSPNYSDFSDTVLNPIFNRDSPRDTINNSTDNIAFIISFISYLSPSRTSAKRKHFCRPLFHYFSSSKFASIPTKSQTSSNVRLSFNFFFYRRLLEVLEYLFHVHLLFNNFSSLFRKKTDLNIVASEQRERR